MISSPRSLLRGESIMGLVMRAHGSGGPKSAWSWKWPGPRLADQQQPMRIPRTALSDLRPLLSVSTSLPQKLVRLPVLPFLLRASRAPSLLTLRHHCRSFEPSLPRLPLCERLQRPNAAAGLLVAPDTSPLPVTSHLTGCLFALGTDGALCSAAPW